MRKVAETDAMVAEAVRPDQIASVVERWTGIPTSKMLEGDREKLLRMEDELGKRVIGQHGPVRAVSNAVRRARAGLNDEGPAAWAASCFWGRLAWVKLS